MKSFRVRRRILVWRRLAQIAVALAFIAVPVLNHYEINTLSGNFLFFNFAGLPIADPLSALQVAALTGTATQDMLIGAGLALLLALLLGPVFCSWICPFGLLSELLHGRRTACPNSKRNAPHSLRPFMGKIFLLFFGLAVLVFFVPVPLLNQLSLPGWYSRIAQYGILYHDALWGGLGLIGAALALERFTGKRFWCAHICPQSVLISLAGLLPGRFRVRFTRKACTCAATDRACLASCSLLLNPRDPGPAQSLRCTNCGDCVDACREKGRALRFGVGGAAPPPPRGRCPLEPRKGTESP